MLEGAALSRRASQRNGTPGNSHNKVPRFTRIIRPCSVWYSLLRISIGKSGIEEVDTPIDGLLEPAFRVFFYAENQAMPQSPGHKLGLLRNCLRIGPVSDDLPLMGNNPLAAVAFLHVRISHCPFGIPVAFQ